MVFPIVTCRCESWTIKKVEPWRTDAFELWHWKRILRAPWTARRSNQSILKEISPGYSLEGLMLKLKLQYSGHLMRRADALEKTPMLGKIEGKRRRGWQRMRSIDSITNSMDMNLSKLQKIVEDEGTWRAVIYRVKWRKEWYKARMWNISPRLCFTKSLYLEVMPGFLWVTVKNESRSWLSREP